MSERVKDGEVELNRLEAGRILDGRYEIIEYIGAGAFAAVYKARQLNIKRPVAIKVLNIINAWQDAATRKAFGDRFLREAQTAAQIRHTNVVTIYDFGIIADLGQPFIAMELLEGHDLEAELRKNGPMEPARALKLMLGSLEALGEGHDLGIVHKDLKPSNLYLVEPGTRRETLKIVDFGIARIQEKEGQKLTGTGQLFGTPQYLAPEYIEQQIATPALDVYQMGLILVEMLTAKTVVDVDNPYKCLMMHCNGDLPIPAALRQGAFGAVLNGAIEVDHKKRYPNANAFGDALRTISPSSIDVTAFDRNVQRQLGEAPTMAPGVNPVASTDVFAQPHATPTPSRPLTRDGLPAPGADAPAEPVDDADEPRRGISPILIGVAAVLLLGVVAGVAMLAFGGTDEPVKADPIARTTGPGETAPQTQAPPTDPADPDEAGGEDGEDEGAPDEAPASAIEVAVRADQEGAKFFVSGEDRGAGPVTLTFADASAAPLEVRVEKAGFQPLVMQVGPNDGPTFAATLTPVALEGTPPSDDGKGKAGAARKVDRKGATAGRPTDATETPVKTDTAEKSSTDAKGDTGKKSPKGMGFVDQPDSGNNKKKSIGFVE